MKLTKIIIALQLLVLGALPFSSSFAADKSDKPDKVDKADKSEANKYMFVIDFDKILVDEKPDGEFQFAPGAGALIESLSRIPGSKVTLVSDKHYYEKLGKAFDTLVMPSGRLLKNVAGFQSKGLLTEVSRDSARQPLNPEYQGTYKRNVEGVSSRWENGNTLFIDDNPTQLMRGQEISWLKVSDAGAPGETARIRGLVEEAVMTSKKTGKNLQESLQSVQWTDFSTDRLHTSPKYDSNRSASSQVYEVGEKILKETDPHYSIPEDIKKTFHPTTGDLFEGKTSGWSSEPIYSKTSYGVEVGPKTAPPLDFVFDLDETIIFKDHHYTKEHPEGKPVGAAKMDAEGTTYTVAPGAIELMQSLSKIPGARISLFSASSNAERNNAVAFKLRLPDGRLLKDILYRVVSGKSTTPITDDNRAELQPTEEIFVGKKKKDLRKIDPAIDVGRAILIDDKPKNMVKGQEHSILYLHNDTANGEASRIRGLIQEAIDKSTKEGTSVADALFSIQFKKGADGKVAYDVKSANSADIYKKGESLLQIENSAFKLPTTVFDRIASAPEEDIKPKPEPEKKYSYDDYFSGGGSSSWASSSYYSSKYSAPAPVKKGVNFVIDMDKILIRKEGEKYSVVPGAMELVNSLSQIPDAKINLFSDTMTYGEIGKEIDALKLPNGKSLKSVIRDYNSSFLLTKVDEPIADRIKNPAFLGTTKKDLTKIGSWGKDLDNVILIDDDPSMAVQGRAPIVQGQEKNMLIVAHTTHDGEAAKIRTVVEDAMTTAKRDRISLSDALWKTQWKRTSNGRYEYNPGTTYDYVYGERLLQKDNPDYHLPADARAESTVLSASTNNKELKDPMAANGAHPIDFIFDLDKVLLFDKDHIPSTFKIVPLKTQKITAVGKDYYLAPGAAELIESVSKIPSARISVFSDSKFENRNWDVLKKIKLPDGRTFADVVQQRVYSGQDMKRIESWSSRYTFESAQPKNGDMFQGSEKKDLQLPHANLDLSRTILIDDDATKMARSQEKSLLFTSHATTYGETSRVRGLIEAAIQKSNADHVPLTDALWSLQWKTDNSGEPEFKVGDTNSESYYHWGAKLLKQTNPDFKLDDSVLSQLREALGKLDLGPAKCVRGVFSSWIDHF